MVIILKAFIKAFNETYNTMSIVSKSAVKYGSVLILTLSVCAIFFFLKSVTADSDGFYYSNMLRDTMLCIKECMVSIYILPMLYEIISYSVKK